MGQCVGKNKNGLRCLHSVKAGERCCYRHIEQDTTLTDSLLIVGVGAILGNLVAPGFGGVMGGALIAKAANWLSSKDRVKKKKVFVSFDFDNDRQLKHLLIGQSKHPSVSFSVADWSLKEAAPENNWQSKARNAIQRGSSVKTVGEFWLGKLAKHVIQSEFCHFEGPKSVCFSHSDFGFVVQTLNNAA